MTQNVTSEDFKAEVLEASGPVLVDFSATWCGPCRAIEPMISKLAEEFEGRVKVVKLDIDDAPDVAQEYNIRGVPTLLFIKGGEEFDRVVGASLNEGQLREKLESLG